MLTRYSAAFFKPSTQLVFCLATFTSLALAFRMMSGVPIGGEDHCDGWGDKCTQGFITNDNYTLVYQFNRYVDTIKGASDGTLKQLAECITFDKVGNALMSAFQQDDNSNFVTSCSASSEFQNARSFANVLEISHANISSVVCDAFTSSFVAVVASCSNGGMAFAYDLAIAAAIFGGMAALALCIWGVCKINTCAKEQSFDCCEKKEEEATNAPAAPTASPV